MRIAAVIPAYNKPDLLRLVVRELLRQTAAVDTIYVIDNASREPSALALAEYGLRPDADDPLCSEASAPTPGGVCRIVCTRLAQNAGCPGGFGVGMDMAMKDGHDWLWLLDDDAAPVDTALEKLLPHAAQDVAALASLPRLPDGRLIATHRARCDRAKLYPGFTIPLAEEDYRPGKVRDLDLAAWAGLFVNAAAAKAVGLPMAPLFLTYCDLEYCLRLAAYGPLRLVTDSLLIHHMDEGYKDRVRCKGLFGTGEFTARRHLWRTFFITRNAIWVGGRYTTRKLRHYLTVARIFLGTAKKILLYADDRRLRLRLAWRATADGLFGRFDNAAPWRILAASEAAPEERGADRPD